VRESAFPLPQQQQHPSARGFFFSLLDRQADVWEFNITKVKKERKRRVKIREP
jgi:hypothetical protein